MKRPFHLWDLQDELERIYEHAPSDARPLIPPMAQDFPSPDRHQASDLLLFARHGERAHPSTTALDDTSAIVEGQAPTVNSKQPRRVNAEAA